MSLTEPACGKNVIGWTARPEGTPAQRIPLLGARLDVPDTRRTMWRGDVGTGDRHHTDGQGSPVPLLTLATCAALVHAAATEIFAAEVDEIEVRDLALDRLLPLGNSTPLITMLDPVGPGRATVSIHTRSAAGRWRRLAAAGVRVDVPNARGTRTEPDPAAFAVEFTLPPAPDAPEVSAAPGRFDAAMLDGCLRAPTSAPRATTADGRLVEIAPDAIPVALRTLRVNTASTAPGTCHGGPSPTGEHGSWSIRLEDADGAMTFDADGVVLRAPGSGETVPELDGAVYEIIWESTPLAVGRPAEPRDWLLLTVDRADGPAAGTNTRETAPETPQEPTPERHRAATGRPTCAPPWSRQANASLSATVNRTPCGRRSPRGGETWPMAPPRQSSFCARTTPHGTRSSPPPSSHVNSPRPRGRCPDCS